MSHVIKAPSAGVPDEAYTVDTVRICDWSFGAYDSSVWDLGSGEAEIKWARVGRTVTGFIRIAIGSDATVPSGYLIIVHPDDLPYPAKVESPGAGGFGQPGGFGALYKANSAGSPPPYNGFRVGLACICQDTLGSGVSSIVFFKTNSQTAIPAALDNLWSPISNEPVPASDLPGATYFGGFVYEAADAA